MLKVVILKAVHTINILNEKAKTLVSFTYYSETRPCITGNMKTNLGEHLFLIQFAVWLWSDLYNVLFFVRAIVLVMRPHAILGDIEVVSLSHLIQ